MVVPGKRILIIEDEADFSQALERHLRRLDYEIMAIVGSADEARAAAARVIPDLVLSDISILGAHDGIELAEEFWRRLDVPVIFLTGRSDPVTMARVRASNSFGYLSKPFRPEELDSAIAVALARHASERHAREVEVSLLAAIRCTSDAVVTADTSGTVRFLNPSAERLLGLQGGNAIGRPLKEVVTLEGGPLVSDDAAVVRNGSPRATYVTTADGHQLPVELTVSPIRDEPLGFIGTVVILRDITERKLFEAELHKSHAEYRALAAHLESVREAERTRIAREIHDELGQMLTGLKYDVAWLEKQYRDSSEVRDRLQEMNQQLKQTMDTVRRIAAELRPGVLDELGLTAAVEWLVRDFERRTGLAVRLEVTTRDLVLVREGATALFRVLQEGLTNVARHAQARSVIVFLREQGPELILEILDDGRGISEGELRRTGNFGLMGMRERISALRGCCDVRGLPGRGTMVRVSVPLGAILAPEGAKS